MLLANVLQAQNRAFSFLQPLSISASQNSFASVSSENLKPMPKRAFSTLVCLQMNKGEAAAFTPITEASAYPASASLTIFWRSSGLSLRNASTIRKGSANISLTSGGSSSR